jgi:hypothetical protein
MMNKKIKVIEYGIDDTGMLGVHAISVVEDPAIGVDFVALSDEKRYVTLASEERKMLYGALLIPDQLIYRYDETQGEYYVKYSKETIEKIAHNYFKQNLHHNATLEHESPVVGLTLVESWLIEGENDKSKEFGFSLPVGTWFGGMKVENDEVWNKVKSGEVKAFSIEGMFVPKKEMKMSEQQEQWIIELEQMLQLASEEEIVARYEDYVRVVNMTYDELNEWAKSECSRLASLDRSPIERNLELLSTPKSEWTEKHFEWAGKTIAFVNRMRENSAGDSLVDSEGNECGSKRTISLKNWAFDPNK